VGSSGDYVRQPYHKGTGSRNCTLSEGNSVAAVSELQRALKACNFVSNLAVDGDFGPSTKKAVAYAQHRYGIGEDGIYGPQSRAAFQWQLIYANGQSSGKCVRVN
jgi:peptidoglycan hydrolase-like protein with peptidoglycan-binding domain